MRLHSAAIRVLALTGLLAAAGCADAGIPTQASAPERPQLSTQTYGATLLECPTDQTRSVSKVIGLLGGTIELDGTKLVIPPGAVLLDTEFTLTIPASNYVEIDVKAGGADHFVFEEPVSLTLSYSRCTRANIDKKNLRIFYIDGASDTILEDLGGTDDKTLRAVTTSIDHLSQYAVGMPY